MAKITLKDGAVREVENGTSVLDFVKNLSNSLATKSPRLQNRRRNERFDDRY